jgi:peptide/nickel transport system permease protein
VLVLPAVTLAVLVMPYLVRLARASATEVFDSEYIRAARLRGVGGSRLLWRHVLPNAAPPTVQATVLVLVYLLGGSVIVETVFAFPGIGLQLVDAVRGRDLPIIQSLALLIAAFYLVLTTVADLATIALTPRLRNGRR